MNLRAGALAFAGAGCCDGVYAKRSVVCWRALISTLPDQDWPSAAVTFTGMNASASGRLKTAGAASSFGCPSMTIDTLNPAGSMTLIDVRAEKPKVVVCDQSALAEPAMKSE